MNAVSRLRAHQGLVAGLLIICLVIVAYLPVWHAGFIWDDDEHLTRNPCIVGPLGFREIWTTAKAVYYPLVLSTFWLVHKFAGLQPLPYHVLNVLMHAACALLLWRVLKELKIPHAWFGAALWAVHPVMVQSVAWITELKNTQSGVFYMLSILLFLKSDQPGLPKSKWRAFYFGSLIAFAAALTSKPATVMLPIILALLMCVRGSAWKFRAWALLAPFFILSVAAAGWTIWEQKVHSGARGAEWMLSFPDRLVISATNIWFYLGKLVWPHPLAFIYPRWKIDSLQIVSYWPVAALLAVTVGLFIARRFLNRWVILALASFTISLFPILGFFDVYFFRYSFVSDHFQYLASMGIVVLIGVAISAASEKLAARTHAVVGKMFCAVFLLGLLALSYVQASTYVDAQKLWRSTIEKNPDAWIAQTIIGNRELENGAVEKAIAHYQKALQSYPNAGNTHDSLSVALLQKGAVDDALSHAIRAATLEPNNPNFRITLGNAYSAKGMLPEGIEQYAMVASAFPDMAEAHYNLGRVLLDQGRADAAINSCRRALSANPRHFDARIVLGNALVDKAQYAEAIREYERALELAPRSGTALNNLAWLLATSPDLSLRNGPRAVQLAEQANHVAEGLNAKFLRTLAVAYAQTGNIPKGLDTGRRALALATADRNADLIESLQEEIAVYERQLTDGVRP